MTSLIAGNWYVLQIERGAQLWRHAFEFFKNGQ